MVNEKCNISDALSYIRCLLVTSLSLENIGENDVVMANRCKTHGTFNHKSVKCGLVDTRLRNLKDRQNDERQRKLEEIKTQALAAQRFKEQKELERRKRLDELKGREDQRHHQVMERKRVIQQAEQERLVAILKRNQERDARIEAKKRNERNSMVFAFGSSTPRMLEPADMLASSFWDHRRSTSTQNITYIANSTAAGIINNNSTSTNGSSVLTRRQSERDLDATHKKRATSAGGGIEYTDGQMAAGYISSYVGRRRTDLMPTIPTRDHHSSSFASSLATSRKSLNVSPGRAYSMSRLDQLAKPRTRRGELAAVGETTTASSASSASSSSFLSSSSFCSSVNKHSLAMSNRKTSRSMSHLFVSKSRSSPPPLPPITRTTTKRQHKQLLESRTFNQSNSTTFYQLPLNGGISTSSPTNLITQQMPRTTRTTQLRQQRLFPSLSNNTTVGSSRPSSAMSQQSTTSGTTSSLGVRHRIGNATTSHNNGQRRQRPASIAITGVSTNEFDVNGKQSNTNSCNSTHTSSKKCDQRPPLPKTRKSHSNTKSKVSPVDTNGQLSLSVEQQSLQLVANVEEALSSTPMNKATNGNAIQTPRIMNTVEEIEKSEPTEKSLSQSDHDGENSSSRSIKVLLTTEEEAIAALAERRRLIREEAERHAEQERLRLEAEAEAEFEQQKREEEQAQLLMEQQRQAEKQRLEQAIMDLQRREEEERLRKEEELRMKQLKEEADRKSREEAERQKIELQERLKNEEKEREARRKRVEAIMLRTRGKNSVNSSLQSMDEDKMETNTNNNKMNGTNQSTDQINIATNGKSVDLLESNILIEKSVSIGATDSMNSNNPWQAKDTFNQLM